MALIEVKECVSSNQIPIQAWEAVPVRPKTHAAFPRHLSPEAQPHALAAGRVRVEMGASAQCGPPEGTVSSPEPGCVSLTAGTFLHACKRLPSTLRVPAWPCQHPPAACWAAPRMPAGDHTS